MRVCGSNRNKSELFIGNKPIPIKIVNKVVKCKVIVRIKEGKFFETGFF